MGTQAVNLHILAAVAEFERDAISRRTTEALAAAKAGGVIRNGPNKASRLKLGNYARIAKAKQAATLARYEMVRESIEATGAMSANAAAADLNARGITTAAGGRWQAGQVLRAGRQLGL